MFLLFQRTLSLTVTAREWLVKGFIPRNEACNPFGRPDAFKGVVAAQLCAHVACGADFLGMPVRQGPTGYFAAERGAQAARRVKGNLQRLGASDDVPSFFGSRPMSLLNDADVATMLAEIRSVERDAGAPLAFLVIDTQSRTMDGDENSSKDGAAYAKAIERIREATNAVIWIIAHTGHDGEKQGRPRGSSTLMGAYDVFYQFKKTGEHAGGITVTIDRDGLAGKTIGFDLEYPY